MMFCTAWIMPQPHVVTEHSSSPYSQPIPQPSSIHTYPPSLPNPRSNSVYSAYIALLAAWGFTVPARSGFLSSRHV